MPFDDLRKGRHSEAHRAYFIPTVIADRQSRLFTDLLIGRLIVAVMRVLDESAAVISFAWVVMPDHVHWLFQLGDEKVFQPSSKPSRLARHIGRISA